MAEPTYEVVWPLGRSVYETIPLAKRSEGLEGKTVCEVWDWLFRGREIFPVIREELRKKYPTIKVVDFETFGDTHGPKEKEVIKALPDLLHQNKCDAVISGIGA
ncbi:MAG: hypothetical protein HYX92_18105 [Chloroflexi bacterium]|nr:hypothetical protein [Chloroflexota bacterium]